MARRLGDPHPARRRFQGSKGAGQAAQKSSPREKSQDGNQTATACR
jgi:hypothetical protein